MPIHPSSLDPSKSRRQLSWATALACLAIYAAWCVAGLTGSAHGQSQNGTAPFAPLDTATPSPSPTCAGAWEIVDSLNPCCGGSNAFSAVAAVSANDIWAVGSAYPYSLVEHWDGTAWSIVSTPMSSASSYLQSVSAASSNDVWAVGGQVDDTQTMIMHWNGVEWSVTPSGTMPGDLNGVAAISANDAWAVGDFFYDGIDRHPLTLHWDGTAWSVVPMPTPRGADSLLHAVSAVSSNDVWAVGCCDDTQAVTAHWDGTAWTLVPNIDGSNAILAAVTAVSSNDVWAGGDSWANFQDYIIHWDGTQWTQVPSLGIAGGNITGMSAVAPNDIWSVGFSYNNSGIFSAHWDGQHWSQVPVQWGVNLGGVAAVSSQNVWTVGESFVYPTGYYPLAEQYTSNCTTGTPTVAATATANATVQATSTSSPTAHTATRTPTRVASATPTVPVPTTTVHVTETATAIQTIAAPTATATATSCPITFSDVPAGSTFYTYIRCMACRGIISGYNDGTFRPNNSVTRGQLAKMVANAAGFNEPAGAQQYQDVAPGSTFFAYVWRLSNRGVIGGYPCGGGGEPCVPPGNLPYFRANNNATRGQISKIVSNAAGFNDPPAGQQFEDVAVGSTFYTYTYRLVTRSVISGYACGGAGEPCNPPNNLSYFRPYNNATRGQTSKIVANTFFPNCQTPGDIKK